MQIHTLDRKQVMERVVKEILILLMVINLDIQFLLEVIIDLWVLGLGIVPQ